MNSPETALHFTCGAVMKNRFMLAPLTNTQSFEDGSLSDAEYNWLIRRAQGQFGLVMTCASHVQEIGKGFPGQLGIFSDAHVKGHSRLASGIKAYGSLAVVQLHHAGMRSPSELIGAPPVCPSVNEKLGARALTLEEVQQLREDFILAAIRAQRSGYDGVEIHGAHGYILTQFLSGDINKREDAYGGSLQNRSRLLFEIVEGIRDRCGKRFLLGVRLSPEKFGMDLEEVKSVCRRLIAEGRIDFLDISLWDCFKLPEQENYRDQTLLDHFTGLDRREVKLTVAGKISSGSNVHKILQVGVDFVTIGRSAILHYDFPLRVMQDPDFHPTEIPVSEQYLRDQGLGAAFIEYMRRWPNFVH